MWRASAGGGSGGEGDTSQPVSDQSAQASALAQAQKRAGDKVDALGRRLALVQTRIQEVSQSMWHATHNRDADMRNALQVRWQGLQQAHKQLKANFAAADVELAQLRRRAAQEAAARSQQYAANTSALPVNSLLGSLPLDASDEDSDQEDDDWTPGGEGSDVGHDSDGSDDVDDEPDGLVVSGSDDEL